MEAAGIHHLGLAVRDLDVAVETYELLFGGRVEHRDLLADQGVEAASVRIGGSLLELLAATATDTPVGRFLARRGPGMHHVAFGVGDLDRSIRQARDAGLELIDDEPRVGMHGSRIAFIHPRSAGGVLTELVESE